MRCNLFLHTSYERPGMHRAAPRAPDHITSRSFTSSSCVHPVIESRRRARSVICVGALALATTAKIRQIESVMHLHFMLHLKSEKSEHHQHWASGALSEGDSVECRHGPARPPRQPIGSSCRLDRRRRTWSDRTRHIPDCKRAFVIRIYEVSRRFDELTWPTD